MDETWASPEALGATAGFVWHETRANISTIQAIEKKRYAERMV
jgi:hypothetical protein